jgi:hypothetical protein
MSESNDKRPHVQIQIDEATAQGQYCNLMLLNHNENEFVIDFAFSQPLQPTAKVATRVIASPRNAKRFMLAMQRNIAAFEQRFGRLDVVGDDPIVH